VGPESLLQKKIILVMNVFLIFSACSTGDNRYQTKSLFSDVSDEVNLYFVHEPAIDSTYYMPESIGSGGAFLDYDNDGDLDIYLLNGATHGKKETKKKSIKNQLYRQEQNGKFTNVTEISGLGDTGYGMGVAVGDIDNDGDIDVYISNDGPDALYRNNGNGTFTNITKESGIDNSDWGISVIFLDYNLDNFLDIFVANYVRFDTSVVCTDRVGRRDYCGPQGFPGYPDRLFQNNGDGTFTDVSIVSGIGLKKSAGLGAISADFNDDLYPDIYVGNDREQNHLWINQGDGSFKDQAMMLGVGYNSAGMAEASMGITVGDIDSDEDLDLFLGHFGGESNTLYRNMGDMGFQDDTTPAALASPSLPYTGFGSGFFDYDNDGDLDLAVANGRVIRGPVLTNRQPVTYWDHYAEPNLVFENDGNGVFQNISMRFTEFSSRVENSRGLVFGDVDNDGDVDLLVTNEGGKTRLYHNEKDIIGNWLIIRAFDPAHNRDANGARIKVIMDGKKILRLVNPGYSFCSSNDSRVHFGLGMNSAPVTIVVQWPGGESETFNEISVDQIVTLRKGEGKEIATSLTLPRPLPASLQGGGSSIARRGG
jgi:hypothetical protein